MKDYPLFWVLLEMAFGLALFIFIIWWTLPRKEKDEDGGTREE